MILFSSRVDGSYRTRFVAGGLLLGVGGLQAAPGGVRGDVIEVVVAQCPFAKDRRVVGGQGGFNRERFFVAGTPTVVADAIEKWLDEDGIDGINLRQYLSFETARDFIELVVPELRRRGRFRERYNEGETLRERLFGAGRARLPGDHFGARYRDPAALLKPALPLRFSS